MAKTGEKHTKLEDLALVELALQRDQGAFALLLEKYRGSLMTHILKYVSVVEDAEDICQRSFEKAFMNIDRYNSQYAFSTWLYNIAQNEAIDHLRRCRASINSVPISTEREALDVLSGSTPEEEFIIDQAVRELISGIQSL
ncbi:MAG: sigma-70 family RNA polymerase sigma factor, partial [Bacteroidales bacterium]|nr:sigma-70 family RNA polymerase sigma factor [Bacteroidales bacterium]